MSIRGSTGKNTQILDYVACFVSNVRQAYLLSLFDKSFGKAKYQTLHGIKEDRISSTIIRSIKRYPVVVALLEQATTVQYNKGWQKGALCLKSSAYNVNTY